MKHPLQLAAVLILATAATTQADEKEQAAAVKKLAQKMAQATMKGEFEVVIKYTYGKVVETLGGKKKAVETIKKQMEQLKSRGVKFTKYDIGDPKPFVTSDDSKFVIIPTELEMIIPGGKLSSESYLLGISSDDGKTWTFADGAGIRNKAQREKLLPKLPEKLKLPEPKQPKLTPTNKK